ncbi:response regulator [Ruminococcaceae bacterium OttesenSCG-928-D13]|nr:response regulator [Ruminococcaceae bacterium OttesenSCG-928-D13]
MYRVMVVDDEPSAQQHICSIIEKKCPEYQVVARAENGEEALARVDEVLPDIVITDVRMPRMDGIGLVSRLHKAHPEIVTVIVSGYQDFEYAKGAIQSGVSDYLLKPLNPSDLHALLERLAGVLGGIQHRCRTELMRAMCSRSRPRGNLSVERYFPAQRYYAVIIRKNGLPKRFTRQTGFEIFSTKEEAVMVYGRDEMEALTLYPADLLAGRSFAEAARQLYEADLGQNPYHYVTAVMHPEPFQIADFPGVVKRLYRQLDERIVIGKSRFIDGTEADWHTEPSAKEKEQRELVEYMIRGENTGGMLAEAEKLFDLWAAAGHNQIYIENQIRYLLHLMKRNHDFSEVYGSYTFLVDEALYYVSSMEELKLEMLALLKMLAPAAPGSEGDDTEQLFEAILSYLHGNMDQPLTISTICGKFSVSQTTLSRWFRKYKNISFNNYLTEIRIQKARQILQQNPGAFIKDVAERVGYGDQFYFSRIFRSVVGLSPSEFVQKTG